MEEIIKDDIYVQVYCFNNGYLAVVSRGLEEYISSQYLKNEYEVRFYYESIKAKY